MGRWGSESRPWYEATNNHPQPPPHPPTPPHRVAGGDECRVGVVVAGHAPHSHLIQHIQRSLQLPRRLAGSQHGVVDDGRGGQAPARRMEWEEGGSCS